MNSPPLDDLYSYADRLLRRVDNDFIRYLMPSIPWEERMIAITGARGTGKTTLMLQRLKYGPSHAKALYATADHPWFFGGTLLGLAERFEQEGGTHLYLDEVHKYPQWSRELKTIYDGFPSLNIIFSASSALDIHRGEADLSRRAVTHTLPGLSFREYLEFHHDIRIAPMDLDTLVLEHENLSRSIDPDFHPIPLFREYLQEGYYPFSKDSSQIGYFIKLTQVINATIESDLAASEDFHPGAVPRLKRLLGVLSASTPYTPNISKLATQLSLSRETIYLYLNYLQQARLLNFLMKPGRGDSVLQKPDKLFIENTNLCHALTPKPDTGTLRETFLMNQLRNLQEDVRMPSSGDFMVGNYTIEAGGRSKTGKQIKNADQPIIAKDGIETGHGKTIPLWMFGLLY